MATRYYFAYGTDMWKDQMAHTCLGSQLHGKGTLSNWKWMINFRGYANIVESTGSAVQGLVYKITQADEDSLDAYLAYPEISSKHAENIQMGADSIQALVYLDEKRKKEGKANNEYIRRMSNAIEDALKAGISDDGYIKTTIRPFIPKLTFGYGSNMWKRQMEFRCPQSRYAGVGVLENWKWIISQRHVANVIRSPNDSVYGLLFMISETDEEKLDVSEGSHYTKRMERIKVDGGNGHVTVLVYIDETNITNGISRPEYIGRVNNGIADALEDGVPDGYIKQYLRPFIPTLYFAYGKHMSSTEMPGVPKLWSWSGLGVLPGWRWDLNDDGYANIVPSAKDVVYGMIYEVDQTVEAQLGQQAYRHYTRQLLRIETSNVDDNRGPKYAHNYVNAVIYVDKRDGTERGRPSAGYIHLMNRAIEKAISVGLPKKYVDKYLRPHIPAPRAGNNAQILDDGTDGSRDEVPGN
ncbi:hypothetical protein APHAL10511_005285 [Amanita phalloides]|nr:hypothetical protein APHAL10511_005285 [Amanita phalloides]